jgi:hypothetical protein
MREHLLVGADRAASAFLVVKEFFLKALFTTIAIKQVV